MKAVQGIRASLHVLRRLPGLLLPTDIEGLALIVGAPPHEEVLIPVLVFRPSDDSDHPLVHFVAGPLLAGVIVIAYYDRAALLPTLRRHRWPGCRGRADRKSVV